MNNEMDDFSIKPNTPNQFGLLGMEANKISPRKRMLSSMTPTLVTHQGEPFLITGSPGGSTIITTVLQVIVNLVDHGMSIADAVALPRFHHQWLPDVIYYGRYGLSPDTITKLRSKGHELEQRSVLGDANSIHIVDGVRYGFKDPRHEGQAVGY
jgi:gamma-glutamyltranspeptidase/glutathione hydrolase